MVLQTQSRSSSEKGYIAGTRPWNFDASISAASPCKTSNKYAQYHSESPIYKDPEKTKIAKPGDGMRRALGAGIVLGTKNVGLESLSAHALLLDKWPRLSSSPPFRT